MWRIEFCGILNGSFVFDKKIFQRPTLSRWQEMINNADVFLCFRTFPARKGDMIILDSDINAVTTMVADGLAT